MSSLARRIAATALVSVVLTGCGGTTDPTGAPTAATSVPASSAPATSAPATSAPASTGPLTTDQFGRLWPVGTTLAGATLVNRAQLPAKPDPGASMLDCAESVVLVANAFPGVSNASADTLVTVASTRYDDPTRAIDDVEQLAGVCLGRQTARSGYDEPRWFTFTANAHGPADQLLVVGYRNIVSMVYTSTKVDPAQLVDAVVAEISRV